VRVIGIDELRAAKGIEYSAPSIYRLIRQNQFPKPIHLGERRVAFVESEIDAWLQAKVDQRDCGADAAMRAERSATARKYSLQNMKKKRGRKPKRKATA
jgi:prophage regulatory protein